MYFVPILYPDLKKGPYFIVHNKYSLNDVHKCYFAEIVPLYQPKYTTLDNVYEWKTFTKIPNKIQLETVFLTFFKIVPTILPKIRQRMLHQILRNLIGDESFSYYIFETDPRLICD
jgi:hypothetical protein